MDIVLFLEFLFTLFLSLVVVFVLVRSKNGTPNCCDNENRYDLRVKKIENLFGGSNQQVEQNVGDGVNGLKGKVGDKSCHLCYRTEEIEEEFGFDEIGADPSEENGVVNKGAKGLIGKYEGDEGLLRDWEGVERTDLERIFSAAVVFVDSKKNGHVIDNELKMQLYGLHKVATEGPCYGPQPMPFKLSARAKWSSWHKLGDMSREKAMEQYIALLSDRVADWKMDKTEGNNGLTSQGVETSQHSWHFCEQVSRRR